MEKIPVTLAKKVEQVKKVMKSIMVVFIDIHITVNSFHRARLSMRPSNEATEIGHFAVSGVTETG